MINVVVIGIPALIIGVMLEIAWLKIKLRSIFKIVIYAFINFRNNPKYLKIH